MYKSLSYLDQVLTHNKLEILGNIITSLIENIFDIDSLLKGIFEHQSDTFRYELFLGLFSHGVDFSLSLCISLFFLVCLGFVIKKIE